MTPVRHVVFDLGNVLIRWDPEIVYRDLIPDEAERRHFLGEVCNHAWLMKTDAGMDWPQAEEELIARHPVHAALIRSFRQRHAEMLPGEITESVAIAERLIDGGIDVTALTNWAADTFLEAERRFPILSRFRGITVSARVGLVKPDLALYRRHAETFGLEPSATLFFDDNRANVEAARRAGWQAEVVTTPAGIAADLKRHGLRTT